MINSDTWLLIARNLYVYSVHKFVLFVGVAHVFGNNSSDKNLITGLYWSSRVIFIRINFSGNEILRKEAKMCGFVVVSELSVKNHLQDTDWSSKVLLSMWSRWPRKTQQAIILAMVTWRLETYFWDQNLPIWRLKCMGIFSDPYICETVHPMAKRSDILVRKKSLRRTI